MEELGLHDSEPLKSTGDGTCLFNSISILIHETEELAPLLRLMSFFYAAINLEVLEQWVKVRIDINNN